MNTIEELQETVERIATDLGPSVVGLGRGWGRGSGVVVAEGKVLTNTHNLRREEVGPRGRRVTGSVEHTAPLPRGSSGGPVVDRSGRLVGINTLRLDGGLILALAGADVRDRVAALVRGDAPRRVTLGVHVAPPHAARRMRRAVGLPERDGILVRRVREGSPAERAGLERGDLIVAIGDRQLERLDDLYAAIDGLAGATTELVVVRGTEERKVAVELESNGG